MAKVEVNTMMWLVPRRRSSEKVKASWCDECQQILPSDKYSQ